ncbi:HPP family protein [Acidovorax sp.]|uniref:CBS domain-containing protein n=1 Tax=Acidovorax sp. TaxID=1872122 RepID=UPI0027BAC535|nr:CBS domain-containing protein [Acidovorax sp.]
MRSTAPSLINIESPSVAAAETMTLQEMQVSSIQIVSGARLLTVGFDVNLADVAALMSGAQLSLVLVCDVSGSVAGVISDTMLIHRLGLGSPRILGERAAGSGQRAANIMARDFKACCQTDSLVEVLAAMHSRGLIHVPILDTDNRPSGVVYARDGLRALLAAGNAEEAQLIDYVTGIGYR